MNKEAISRDFDLGAILNITTERMFTNICDVFDIMDFLVGEEIFLHQIPSVMKQIKPYVLSVYPELKGVGDTVIINSEEDANRFINEQKEIFGKTLSLSPMSKIEKEDYEKPVVLIHTK